MIGLSKSDMQRHQIGWMDVIPSLLLSSYRIRRFFLIFAISLFRCRATTCTVFYILLTVASISYELVSQTFRHYRTLHALLVILSSYCCPKNHQQEMACGNRVVT